MASFSQSDGCIVDVCGNIGSCTKLIIQSSEDEVKRTWLEAVEDCSGGYTTTGQHGMTVDK